MQETLATMITSLRSSSECVAEWRMRSMSSLMRRVLLDVRVRRRHVGLGLVVVVVRDEVLDGVVREELLELAVELRRQRLVVRDDQRRHVELWMTFAIVNVLPEPVTPSSV